MRKQRTADAAANMARFDEQLVQVQRTWRIAGRERDDAGNLSVGPGRDPPIAGRDGSAAQMRLEITITSGIEPDLVARQQATGHRVRGRLTDPHRPGALVV